MRKWLAGCLLVCFVWTLVLGVVLMAGWGITSSLDNIIKSNNDRIVLQQQLLTNQQIQIDANRTERMIESDKERTMRLTVFMASLNHGVDMMFVNGAWFWFVCLLICAAMLVVIFRSIKRSGFQEKGSMERTREGTIDMVVRDAPQ